MTRKSVAPLEQGAIEGVFRTSYGRAVATLIRVFGDIAIAEDAVQDAFVVASDRWPRDGIPPNAAGWIVTTARRRAIDGLRRSARGRELIQNIGNDAGIKHSAAADQWVEDDPVPDDQLRLIFTCCHPSLRIEHQVALTLRLLGGLTVEEIARSFLVSEAAMAKRLVRAKYKIKAANIAYRLPAEAELPERLQSVLSVIYLIYNSGADDPKRAPLRADAIRLGRVLVDLMPDEPEAAGLLALMLFNESRVAARLREGQLVQLADQDRACWDGALIAEGHAIVRACIDRETPGPYQLQAAIQAVHCYAKAFEETDWPQIVALYDHLYALMPTAVVALNRAIAVGEVSGPDTALYQIDAISTDLDGYHLMHAARGSMLRRLGQRNAAAEAYARAAQLATTDSDRLFLREQAASLR